MKKLFITALSCLLTLSISNQLMAQESAATHRIIHTKFQPENLAKGMKIAKNYCKAYAAVGHAPTLFEFGSNNQKWDGIFIIPLAAGIPAEGDPHPKVVMKQLTKMLGAEVNLAKLHEEFMAMITEISIQDVRQGTF